jgi:hypothetical protein
LRDEFTFKTFDFLKVLVSTVNLAISGVTVEPVKSGVGGGRGEPERVVGDGRGEPPLPPHELPLVTGVVSVYATKVEAAHV